MKIFIIEKDIIKTMHVNPDKIGESLYEVDCNYVQMSK